MEQGINLSWVMKRRNKQDRSFPESLELCRNAGFFILDYITDVECGDYIEKAKRAREELDRRGMHVEQSHGPFYRYSRENPPAERFRKYAPRAVEAASILGAKYLVLHTDEITEQNRYNDREILQITSEYLAPTVDLCVKHGIRPAFETVFDDFIGKRFGSHAEQLLNIIDIFSGAGAGCCFDFGHGYIAFADKFPENFALLLPHVVCTHVHDNSWKIDMHKPAYLGTIDWEMTMSMLRKSGYSGEFVWEFGYERFPDALMPDYLQFIHRTGEYLLSI